MTYEKQGTCNQCGRCCMLLIDIRMRKLMDESNNCRYIYKAADGKWYCRVREWKESNNERMLQKMTEFELRYYERECVDYPDPNNEAHWDGSMPEECTISRKSV